MYVYSVASLVLANGLCYLVVIAGASSIIIIILPPATWVLLSGTRHEDEAVLLPGFAIKW